MKTLINKWNPQIRITAPEIITAHPPVSNEGYVYWIPAINEMYNPIDWTLVEEEPIGEEYTIEVGKHTHTLRVGSQSDIDNLIRKEIERRMDKHWDLLPNADSPEDDWTHNELCELGAFKELEHLEQFLDSLQQEQPEEICSKCVYHGKDYDCYYPHGGMRTRINENGVYECTGFYAKEQEQHHPIDLEEETKKWWKKHLGLEPEKQLWMDAYQSVVFARHFYELGRIAQIEQNKALADMHKSPKEKGDSK